MRVLILANGEPPSPELAQRLRAEHDILLATDGAVHTADKLGIAPNLVSGDFDSLRFAEAQLRFPEAEFIVTLDQDYNDLEKAILVARERGATSFTILGALGGRLDHSLANIALLARYHIEVSICILDDKAAVWAVSGTEDRPGEQTIVTTIGNTVSLLSLEGTASVTIAGVSWPLDRCRLPVGSHGVSNVAVSDRVALRVSGGVVLVCTLFGDAPAEVPVRENGFHPSASPVSVAERLGE